MFYHDHAYGITRLNVYAGEAAGYLLTDPAKKQALIDGAGVPFPDAMAADLHYGIPLVIQDKTFVAGAATFTALILPMDTKATDPLWARQVGRRRQSLVPPCVHAEPKPD